MSKKDGSMIRKMLARFQRHGIANTLHYACMKIVNLAFPFAILRGVYVERPDQAFLDCPEPYSAGFLSAHALSRYAQDPATELSAEFLANALPAGDECYAICHGETLASYGWYATGPTPAHAPALKLRFAPGWVYMYKGFTDTRHRGRRLHAIGMTRALQHYVSRGHEGIVSYVESTNFDSLKSCYRMGYRVFGSIYVARLFGRYFTFSSPGCERFDFRLEHAISHTGLVQGP